MQLIEQHALSWCLSGPLFAAAPSLAQRLESMGTVLRTCNVERAIIFSRSTQTRPQQACLQYIHGAKAAKNARLTTSSYSYYCTELLQVLLVPRPAPNTGTVRKPSQKKNRLSPQAGNMPALPAGILISLAKCHPLPGSSQALRSASQYFSPAVTGP
jgi:hypothetical protein